MTRALQVVIVALCSGCCSTPLPPISRVSATLPARDHVWAGVSEVDITPPIGLGLFGHAPESRVSTGIALRLRCQAFVIGGPSGRSGTNDVVALVPCELPAPSLALKRAIAQRVADRGVPIPETRIALMATHDHYAPGHFLTGAGYTGPFSARRTGYDENFVKWLAVRIGDSIVAAYARATRVRIAWSYSDVEDIARNRSYLPFSRNHWMPEWLRSALKAHPDRPDTIAVDKTLSLLRIDRQIEGDQYVPAGVLAIYGVHPTVLGNHNSLYSGDLFGYATRDAVARIREQCSTTRTCDDLVLGIANGIEGDVTSARTTDTHRESRRLGIRLGSQIFDAWKGLENGPFETSGPFAIAYRELHWSGAIVEGCPPKRLCRVPGQGTPTAGGAPDHPTGYHIFPMADAGVRRKVEAECGGYRFPLLGIDPNAGPGDNYPDVAPIMLVRAGRGTIATVPAEVTTIVGLRIRDVLAQALPELDATARIAIVGLTNEYLGYITTKDEYDLQHYEGASTLYGPHSAEFLEQQFKCLAAGLSDHARAGCREQPPIDTPVDAPFKATTASVFPQARAIDASSAPRGLSPVCSGVDVAGDRFVEILFDGPDAIDVREYSDLAIEVRRGEAVIADARGIDIHVFYDDFADSQRWRIRWYPPAEASPTEAALKFEVHSGTARASSAAFQPHNPSLPRCVKRYAGATT